MSAEKGPLGNPQDAQYLGARSHEIFEEAQEDIREGVKRIVLGLFAISGSLIFAKLSKRNAVFLVPAAVTFHLGARQLAWGSGLVSSAHDRLDFYKPHKEIPEPQTD